MNFARVTERNKWERRERRAFHVANRVFGTKERPRLSVYRSVRHFHCQLIDDAEGRTLAAASTVMKDLRGQVKNGGDKKAAALVGEKLVALAKAKGITKVVFDRNFYQFHGRVRAFAEAAAKGGLQFLVNPVKGPKKPKEPKAEKAGKPEKAKAQKPPKPPGGPKPEGQGKPPPKSENK